MTTMKTRAVFSLTVLLAVPLSFSASAVAQGLPPAAKQKIETAQKHVKTIGMEEYRKIVDNPGTALIIDVREPQEYAAGHVPGAINIPRGLIESKIWDQVGSSENPNLERPIVLQCQAGKRATLAAQTLGELGFTQTSAVIMSLDEWQKTGNPFVK
ncbi:MAG: rhodanese-like domain-containing protein [Nitrospira sp.]|nr:rhodanese-like domain-containing protein [Nitrospira sp.]MDH4303324.1 rhodanese-like domain-containing protein [Nitrospira sp.]MDH5193970.1 rhodanese-like domain-containing protein [Nitrospira sp.]